MNLVNVARTKSGDFSCFQSAAPDFVRATYADFTVAPYRFAPGEFRIKHVSESWERRACAELRRAVFCDEQQIFEHDDADALDACALPIAAIACLIGQPDDVVGTVRICETEPGTWWGSRLAVRPDYRRSAWLGGELIHHAVCTAHARGAKHFYAQVQVQNVKLFERLHWTTLDAVIVQGRPHVLMQADLAHYPARAQDDVGFFSGLRAAA
ncbi:MSMEG_0567/Sll0786 family nitrogen starvation N-acetyltransferase [Panacagrimonas perspica]|uniref:MSMEG_0567/Sll0786 family nitrogen starvation N-acetyltransferase n=1 Tax=Panacagrimonas perspica TaxID=381431 RepID=UPI001FE8116C|nr:MSMEG_0567/Sll0786 family nitrogen starvation N-acetyltransferase [Panacagrimonas perspica]